MLQMAKTTRSRRFDSFDLDHGQIPAQPRANGCTGRIAAIRKAIADGTYETPGKIEIVVQTLLEELRPAPHPTRTQSPSERRGQP